MMDYYTAELFLYMNAFMLHAQHVRGAQLNTAIVGITVGLTQGMCEKDSKKLRNYAKTLAQSIMEVNNGYT